MSSSCDVASLAGQSWRKAVERARDQVLERRLLQPTVAIILGSGLGGLAAEVQHAIEIPFHDIPGFPRVSAAGHAGRLLLGFISGVPVVLMQGRAHRYEGWTNRHVQFPVHCMHAIGAETLIVTNAAGGLNPRYRPGDLMVIDGHIDFLWERRGDQTMACEVSEQEPAEAAAGMTAEAGRLVRKGSPYDFGTIQRCKTIARRQDTTLHQGTYISTLGPTYETRAEYKMFREFGGDAVGMSTTVEVQAAARLGMSVAAFSVITNVASTDAPISTTHEEVVDVGNQAGPKLMQIISQLLNGWAGEPD